MNEADRQLIFQLQKESFVLRKLYSQHKDYEERLSRFEKRSFLLPSEEVEARQLKKQKLRGVDRMMSILQEHKAEGYPA